MSGLCCRRVEPFEEMLHVALYLFDLPDLEFVVSFGDTQICNRCGAAQ